MKKIVGRIEDLRVLEKIYDSNKAEFLAVYGRRRIGKTYLIREFFADKKVIFFNLTGAKKGVLSEQLAHFTQQLSLVFYDNLPIKSPKTWDSALELLTQAMNRQAKKKKIVLFFDELPWLATKKSRLLENLDYYWNQHWSNNSRIKLIICGSSASWIIRKIIQDKGGLHNRITHKMRLDPFTLSETKALLHFMGIKLNHQQILMIYMVTGGIPYYLSYLEKGLSATQNIENLAFNDKGLLFKEFDILFSSLFDEAENYIQMMRVIAEKRSGIGQQELLNCIGKSALGGAGLKRLADLEETGFIMSFMPFQHKRQGIYYRVIDEYTLFYLKWLDPLKQTMQPKGLLSGGWQAIENTPEWHNWLGYAFEAVCYKHLLCIREALGIKADAVADSWRFVPRKGFEQRGAQIDLLFDRHDNVITLCEMKYTEKPFAITKEYAAALQRKMQVFQEQTKTPKHLFVALISANGLKNNFYAEELVAKVVELDDLFQ